MLDFADRQIRVVTVAREGRAMQRCNLSARSMPGDGQEYIPAMRPFSSSGKDLKMEFSCFFFNA